jgi:protein dithiol oxidoreductase (disulfide-forming)
MRLGISIFALTFLALSTSLQASIIAGHDYVVLSTPQRQESNGKIEVVEFFSWGCPHCYEFYPKLSHWLSTLPKDAAFKRVPVGLGHPEWEALARAYYALQSTGDVDRLDSQIFEDIHKNHVWLYDEQSITAWVGKHGVNVAKFTEAFRSFNVNMSAGQAEQRAEDYRIPGVPTLAIAGKYTVDGDQAKMLTTSDQLIAMEGAAKKKAVK